MGKLRLKVPLMAIGLVVALAGCSSGNTPRTTTRPATVRGIWSSTQIQSSRLLSISCPASSFCMAMGQGPGDAYPQGYTYTYSGGTWSAGRELDPYTYRDSVACPSSSFCMMVDSLPDISPEGYAGGYAFSYSDGTWSSGQMIDPHQSLYSVSCPSPSFCMTVDTHGHVFTYSDSAWAKRVSRPLLKFSGGHSLFRLLPDRTWRLF